MCILFRFGVAKAEGKLVSLEQADEAILGAARLLSANITALAHTFVNARMLMSIIETGKPITSSAQIFQLIESEPSYLSEAVEEIKQNILLIESSLAKDATAQTARFGKACANPGDLFD